MSDRDKERQDPLSRVFEEYEKVTGETIAERAKRIQAESPDERTNEEKTPEEIAEDEFWEKAAAAAADRIWRDRDE